MTTQVTTDIVRLSFDGNKFKSGIEESMNMLSEMKERMDFTRSIKQMSNLDTAANSVDFSQMAYGIDNISGKLTAMGVVAATVVQSITRSVIGATKNLFMTAVVEPMRGGVREFELQMNAVQTILANTKSKGTVLEDVTGVLAELNDYADLTIYNFGSMIDSIGKFTTAGVDLDTSVEAIKGIANLAALSGSNSQQASTAMYQLSQAISSGTVRLMDWNSVVNAGMGGEIFQQALIDTARIGNASIDSIIETAGGFRGSLEKEWLTSKVLLDTLAKFTGDVTEAQLESIGYTKEQIAGIIEMGETANDAATKIKTFTQLKDTMAEAVESGWSQTWGIIFGNFDEAKAMFTSLGSIADTVISASANARNAVLGDWKNFGGRDVLLSGLITAIDTFLEVVGLAKDAYTDIFPPTTAIQLYNASRAFTEFVESLKMGEESSEKFKNIIRGLASVLDIMKMAAFAVVTPLLGFLGILRESSGGIFDMASNVGLMLTALREVIEKTDFFGASLKILGAPIRAIGGYLERLFDAFLDLYIIRDLSKYIDGLHVTDLSSGLLVLWGAVAPLVVGLMELRTSFLGLDIVKDFAERFNAKPLQGFNNVIQELRYSLTRTGESLEELKEGLLGIEVIGDFFDSLSGYTAEDFNAWIQDMRVEFGLLGESATELKSEFLDLRIVKDILAYFDSINPDTIVAFVDGFITSIADLKLELAYVKEKWDAFKDSIVGTKSDKAGKYFDMLKDTIEVLEPPMVNVTSLFDILKGILGGVFSVIKTLLPIFYGLALAAADGVAGLFNSFTDAAGNFDFLEFIKTVNAGLVTALLVAMNVLINGNWLTDIFGGLLGNDNIDELIDTAIDMFGGLEDALMAWQNNLKANMLLKIAGAIGIITASVVVLSSIDDVKLAKALAAIGVMMVELFGSSGAISQIKGGIGAGIAMMAMATALLLLTISLKILGDLDGEQISKGLIAIGASLAILIGAVKLLSATDTKGIITSSAAMILLSLGLIALSLAVRSFGSMDYDTLTQGLIGVAVSLAGFAIFSRTVDGTKMIGTAVAIGVLGGALMIMAIAISDMAAMSWEELGRGLAGMAGALAILVATMHALPKNVAVKAGALVVMSAALYILAEALLKLSTLSWDEVARALIALGGALLILTVALHAMGGTLMGSAALVVASVGLLAMSHALTSLGGMSWEEILRGLAALAGIFVVLGLGALVLTPLIPAMMGLGVAMAVVGVGALALGAGIYLAALGLTMLAVSAAAVAGAVVLIGGAVIGLIPAFIEAVGRGLLSILQVIVDGAPLLFEAAKLFILGFLDVIVETTPAIVDGLLTMLVALMTSIADNLPEFLESGYSILTSLLRGLADNIEEIVILVADIVLAFLRGIEEKLPDIVDGAFTFIIAFIDGLAEAMDEHLPTLITSVNNLGMSFVEGFITGVFSAGTDVYNAVVEMGQGALDALVDILDIHSPSRKTDESGRQTALGFAGGMAGEDSAVRAAIEQLIDTMLSSMSKRDPEFFILGALYADQIRAGFVAKFMESIDLMVVMLVSLLTRLNAYGDRYRILGLLLANAISTGFIVGLKAKLGRMSKMLSTLLVRLTVYRPEFYRLGQVLLQALLDGAYSMDEELIEAFVTLLEKSVSVITLKQQVFSQLGANLAMSLARGIDSNAWVAVSAAAAMAAAVAAAASDQLGVHSPSTVFLAIAGFIIAGLVNGLNAGGSEVDATFAKMSSNAQNGMNQVINDIIAIMSGDLGFNPTITPVLDMTGVTADLQRMSDSLSTIAVSSSLSNYPDTTRTDDGGKKPGEAASGLIQYIQNNYSPKALDAVEIYRQTDNQINRLTRRRTR